MARLEVTLRTGLRFHTHPPGFAPPTAELGVAETVGIAFEGRTIVWHEIPPTPASPPFPEMAYGPTATVMYDGTDEDRDAKAALMARFLSALVFAYELVVEPVAPYFNTGSGEPDPYAVPIHREMSHFAGTMMMRAPESVEVAPDERLRLALAVYREGVNATSPYLGFFAFWSVLDAVFGTKKEDVDAFINAEANKESGGMVDYVARVIPSYKDAPPPSDAAKYLRKHGRNAIGHVIRDSEKLPHGPG